VKNKDQINPKLIHEFVRAHDRHARQNRKDWSLYKHTYMTRYWEYMTGDDMPKRNRRLREVEVEVNRLWGVITSYLSALYPRASRVILGSDPAGKGDPQKAELAINRMLASRKIHERVMTALRQSLLYPGSGVKVGYHHGRGSALDRVWMRVIPVWEMLLDTEVSDVDDERFRGHLYYRPKIEVEQEYGLSDLSGTRRVDFLSSSDNVSDDYKNRKRYEVAEEDNNFVRVLEFCNLVDHYQDPENPDIKYEGRLEIYVLGQGKDSKEPVYVGPLPFVRHDGEPMAHIVPLIFNYEPEFPLRGIAHVKRLMPQFKELNAYRSYMAMATRKDTRQYVTRKGTLNAEEMTLLTEGHDGLILEVDSGYERPLNDAIIPIQNAPISSNIQSYVRDVETDIERVIGTSPASRGIVTKATAFEVETVQQYTESEFGLHAAIKDQWLSNLTELMLRALIASMQDDGDSQGAYEDQKVDVSEVGATPQEDQSEPEEPKEPEVFDKERIKSLAEIAGIDVDSEDFKDLASQITDKRELDDMSDDELNLLGSTLAGRTSEITKANDEREEEQVDMALVRNTASMQEPFVDEDVVSDLGIDEKDGDYSLRQETIILRERNEQMVVTVEDLDANFEISFVEGGRTPLSDAAMQQNLVALMQPYMALWDSASKGGPQGVIAKNYMQVLADRFDLPKDLHPDELKAELEEQEAEDKKSKKSKKSKEKPQEPPGQAAAAGPPPEQQAPGESPEAPPPPEGQAQAEDVLAQIAQMPPDQAIEALRQLFADQPELIQVLDQISAMPPDQQSAAIQQVLEAASANI
jgi:sRNA-binding protein|tara:strand:+ start:3128 stop:5548 length:2421 start_codon:yes stop_codon:yes gene_type:complete